MVATTIETALGRGLSQDHALSVAFMTVAISDIWQWLGGILDEGNLCGEMGLLDGTPRSAGVIACGKVVCLSISRQAFDALTEQYPEITTQLMRNITRLFAARLRVANNMITELER